MKKVFLTVLLSVLPLPLMGQAPGDVPPVIDVHLHATGSPGPVDSTMQTLRSHLALMDSLNVRRAVLNGVANVLNAPYEEPPIARSPPCYSRVEMARLPTTVVHVVFGAARPSLKPVALRRRSNSAASRRSATHRHSTSASRLQILGCRPQGWGTRSAFSRVFRQLYRVPPSEYPH